MENTTWRVSGTGGAGGDAGTENYGGPVVTAGKASVFIGATNFDQKFRAFDEATGNLLWENTLPLAGNSTPITYEVNGRQYVLIYTTTAKDRPNPDKAPATGGIFVAYALGS